MQSGAIEPWTPVSGKGLLRLLFQMRLPPKCIGKLDQDVLRQMQILESLKGSLCLRGPMEPDALLS